MRFTQGHFPPREGRHLFVGNFSFKSRSNPSNAQFASAGEIIPPCGVPSVVSWRTCLSKYPAFSHFWRMARSIGTRAKSQSWEIRSKQDLTSPSRIHCGCGLTSVLKHCSIASAQDRCWRNPYELWSAVVSTTGSSASRYNALGSIFHGGDTERTHRFTVRFRDINTSKRLRLIASTLEFMYGLYLLLWRIPNFSVHTRGFLALVFRHSSNGENFAAIRVGQQVLQSSRLAPSAFLHRLHDTHLESANVAVDGLPVNGIPFRRFA